jgi:hypothetical protein
MDPADSVEMRCKREGCAEQVVYRPMVVPGALKRTLQREVRERTVYLRCPQGHVHPYRIKG